MPAGDGAHGWGGRWGVRRGGHGGPYILIYIYIYIFIYYSSGFHRQGEALLAVQLTSELASKLVN